MVVNATYVERENMVSIRVLSENVDLDFEKAESDIFSNEEELLEILDRQEEVIAQARSLCVPFDKRVMTRTYIHRNI